MRSNASGLAAETGEGGGEALPDELILGLVPSDDIDHLVLDGDELAALLSAELGIPVTALVTDSYAALVIAMQTGQADVGMFGPIALVQSVDQAGAVPILQSVRFGASKPPSGRCTKNPALRCFPQGLATGFRP